MARAKSASVAASAADAAAAGSRPVDWRGLVGYSELLAQWQTLVERETLPPVLLLSGRAGLGKRALLSALTALHLCERGTACGECGSCTWLLRGEHPEVLWLEAQGASFLLEDAARLQEHLALKPGPGSRYRIVVLVDCDKLTVLAANRLLKTLEEPPASARILLSSSRVGALLPTVLSRTVRWRVAPPPVAVGQQWVTAQLSAQGQQIAPAAAHAALLATGLAPGLALAQLQEELNSDGPALGLPLQRLAALTGPTSAGAGLAAILAEAEATGRNRGLAAADVLRGWEMELNRSYRARLATATGGSQDPAATVDLSFLTQRRQLLRAAKQLAIGARIALNTQLLCEALAFAERP